VHIRPVLWPACRSATPPTEHPSIQNNGDTPLWFQFRSLIGITRTRWTIAQPAFLAPSTRFLSGSFWDVSMRLSPAITLSRIINLVLGWHIQLFISSIELLGILRTEGYKEGILGCFFWTWKRLLILYGTMHFYELYTRVKMTALSKLVSVSPNRLSVIFLLVCHRVPFCL
jgi:hypothetical protein